MKKLGYLRVSTGEQCLDRQILGLRDLCDEMHSERVSATADRRPVYERVIAKLEKGDALVVWDLDRAFRSMEDAIVEMWLLRERGIEIHIVSLQWDRSTSKGRLLYNVQAAVAQYEREELVERTQQGIEAARRRGVRLGRPPKLNGEQLAYAAERLSVPGTTIASIANELGVAPWTLTRAMRRISRMLQHAEDSGDRSA